MVLLVVVAGVVEVEVVVLEGGTVVEMIRCAGHKTDFTFQLIMYYFWGARHFPGTHSSFGKFFQCMHCRMYLAQNLSDMEFPVTHYPKHCKKRPRSLRWPWVRQWEGQLWLCCRWYVLSKDGHNDLWNQELIWGQTCCTTEARFVNEHCKNKSCDFLVHAY